MHGHVGLRTCLHCLVLRIELRSRASLTPLPPFVHSFNMRELSKVFQGVILASRDRLTTSATAHGGYGGNVTSPEGYLLGLWLHECRCAPVARAHGGKAAWAWL